MTASDFSIIETTTATRKVDFPYIPGLLSFREAPACIEAIEKLKTKPDCLIVDGQGIAHPRRLGIASHIGLLIDKPTVGCAKSRLIGTFDEPGSKKGSFSPLVDSDEEIGVVLRTRTDVKPVYVSVGHKCTLNDAISVVLQCTTKYRLPEPSRLAHQLVGQSKTRLALVCVSKVQDKLLHIRIFSKQRFPVAYFKIGLVKTGSDRAAHQ